METDDLTKQIDEVEALSSIYESDFITDCEATRSYSIRIKEKSNEVMLSVTMPPDYPTNVPPKFEISAPWMDREMKETVHRGLDEVYLDNIGEPVIYQSVEKIRDLLRAIKVPKVQKKPKGNPVQQTETSQVAINPSANPQWSSVTEYALGLLNYTKKPVLSSGPLTGCIRTLLQPIIKCPKITHGQVIIDRKSSFQGHAAEVYSLEDVHAVIATLKENKKILNATHNMYAYRIEKQSDKGTTVLQDCDDDGETHAGGRMLHLLQILEQKNTLVVVSRWYGGVQLGPDRFRHINNATRQVIQQAGLLNK